jgi:hypothetical protein
VGVWSVAKVLGALYAGMGLLFGAIFALISLAGAGIAGAADSGEGAMFGALFGVGAVIFLPIVYGLCGVVFGALSAWLYNVFAGIVGGIELDLQGGGVPVR